MSTNGDFCQSRDPTVRPPTRPSVFAGSGAEAFTCDDSAESRIRGAPDGMCRARVKGWQYGVKDSGIQGKKLS